MSLDLTLWHDPKLRRFSAAMARLDQPRPASARAKAKLDQAARAITALPASPEPILDAASGSLGLCLSASQAEALPEILAVAARFSLCVWDPQSGVVTYADGSDSRAEQLRGGVHEGVDSCLAELAAPAPEAERLDGLSALLQFAAQDSTDVPAAVRRSLPALLELLAGPPGAVADRAWSTVYDLCLAWVEADPDARLGPELEARLLAVASAPRIAALRWSAPHLFGD